MDPDIIIYTPEQSREVLMIMQQGALFNDATATVDQPTDRPPMTLSALTAACAEVARELCIGPRCVARSTAYADYVSIVFHVPAPTPEDVALMRRVLGRLCAQHGWQVPEPIVRAREVRVILTRQPPVPAGDARMPQ